MSRRVPVLRENDVLEAESDAVNGIDDRVSARNGQLPAGTEIVLHVDDDECILGSDLHTGPDAASFHL
jgi:hypothetical protein